MTKQAAVLGETQTADAMLRARAYRVVPGGMWGHLNAARLPEGFDFAAADVCSEADLAGAFSAAREKFGRVDVVVKAEQPEPGSAVAFGPGAGVAQGLDTRERYFNAKLAFSATPAQSGELCL